MLNSQFVGDRVNQSPLAEHRKYKEKQSLENHKENLNNNQRVREETRNWIRGYSLRQSKTDMRAYYLTRNSERKMNDPDYNDPFSQDETSQYTTSLLQKRGLVNWEERDTSRSIKHQQMTQEERTLAWVEKHFSENGYNYTEAVRAHRSHRTSMDETPRDLPEAMAQLDLRPVPYCQNANGFASKHSTGFPFY